jgi:menaquinone-specific isochorismate synthase
MMPDSLESLGSRSISLPKFQESIDKQVTEAVIRLEKLSGSFESIPISYTTRCEKINILRWLQRVSVNPRVYWRDREGDLEVAGIGSICIIAADHPKDFAESFRRIDRILKLQPDNPFLRFFGGTRFDPQTAPDQLWQSFPGLWFVLPQLIVTRTEDEYFLTVTVAWDGVSNTDEIQTRLYDSLDLFFHPDDTTDKIPPRIVARTNIPDCKQWSAGIAKVLAEIDVGKVDKVVLARRCDLQLSGTLDSCQYLETLIAQGKRCYGFLFQPNRSAAFVGLTPERLFNVTGNHLVTEAIAGTIAVGDSNEETAANAAQLLERDKNRHEQRYVVDGLRAKLAELCDTVEPTDSPQILQLTHVQHLITHLAGTLRPSVTLSDIYAAIHPTAAVCGTPSKAALSLLTKIERFDRGWYASGVGVISNQSTELAVAIRSGLIIGKTLSLFAGAGIVRGSDADLEWQELEHKLAAGINALTGGSR